MNPPYLFVYGILKRSQADLSKLGAEFIGEAQLNGANLYRIGSGVGLRFVEDPNRVAYGEVFKIPDHLWKWLDKIEANGIAYTRKVVKVHMDKVRSACGGVQHEPGSGCADCREAEQLLIAPVEAWVYEHIFPGMEYRPDRIIADGRYQYVRSYHDTDQPR